MKFSTRAPSPAMIVAVVALSLAVGGTAIAGPGAISDKITKSKVKKVAKKQANKLLNSREAGLNVASAKTADSATNAVNAVNAGNSAEVGGNKIVRIDFRPAGAATQTILDLNGLQMQAACDGTNDTITATTTVPDSEIYFHTVRAGISVTDDNDDEFQPGDPAVNLHPGQTSRQLIGQIRYISGAGDTVTVEWGSGTDIPGATCLTFGYAIGN